MKPCQCQHSGVCLCNAEPGATTWEIKIPKYVSWKPQEDITTYELAKAIPFIVYNSKAEDIPQELKRHFEIV